MIEETFVCNLFERFSNSENAPIVMTLKHDQGFFELDRPANMAVSQYEGPGEFWLIPCLDAVTETLEFLSKKLKKYGGKYKVSEGIRVSVHSFDLFTLKTIAI